MRDELVLAIDGGPPVRTEPLDFAKGAALLGAEEAEAVAAVVRSRSLFRYKDGLATGTVADFERAACEALGCTYAIAVANGTSALRCALAALGVGCGDEVVVPAFTFIATVNAVVAAGAVPVFAEVDDTLGLDPDAAAPTASPIAPRRSSPSTSRTSRAISTRCSMSRTRHGIPVIEDTAQAIGATYHGRHLGTFGALGAFSLQQEKNITAGEGGLVVTDDETLYLRATRYSDQGGQFVTSYASARGEELSEPFAGENLRMGELAGAVARRAARPAARRSSTRCGATRRASSSQVGDIDGLVRRRRPDPDGDGSSSITWFLPDARTAKRFAAALRAEGVPCAQMYRGRPVYLSPSVLARRTASGKGGPVGVRRAPDRPHLLRGVVPADRGARRPLGDRARRRRLRRTRLRRRRRRRAQGRVRAAVVSERFAVVGCGNAAHAHPPARAARRRRRGHRVRQPVAIVGRSGTRRVGIGRRRRRLARRDPARRRRRRRGRDTQLAAPRRRGRRRDERQARARRQADGVHDRPKPTR